MHTNKGVFEVCFGETTNKQVEITPMRSPAQTTKADWYVVVFIDKQKTRADSSNALLLKNDETFKTAWSNVDEFVKTIKYKFWMDLKLK